MPPYSTASLVRPIAAGSLLATGAIGQQPQPWRTRAGSTPSSCSLCSAVSTTRALIWTEPQTDAVGAIRNVTADGLHPAPLRHLLDDLRRRVLAGLQAKDRPVGLLAPGQLLEQILGSRQRASRTAGHREEVLVLELPAGVLRGQARGRGLVGGDADAGPGPVADRDRHRVEPAPAPPCTRPRSPGRPAVRRAPARRSPPAARPSPASGPRSPARRRRRPWRPPVERHVRSSTGSLRPPPRRRRSGSRPG